MTTEINWGYNCLTQGIHHGRPEAIWNLPLLQAIRIFPGDMFFDLVIARIYNDAMQYVDNPSGITGNEIRWTHEWADRVQLFSIQEFPHILQSKVDEILKYYDSPERHRDVEGVIERVKANKLNPGYEPLHPHDSINLLCRILGTRSSIEASR